MLKLLNKFNKEKEENFKNLLLIFCFSLNISKEKLISNNYEIIINTKGLLKLIKNYIRLLLYEPVFYIIKEKEFYNYSFFIKKGILIPRPETELLVDKVLEKFKILLEEKKKDDKIFIKIFEIGTGSGAVIISVFFEILNYLVKNILINDNIINNNNNNNNYENINKSYYKNDVKKNFQTKVIKIEIVGVDKFKVPFEVSLLNFEKILKEYLEKNKKLFQSYLDIDFFYQKEKNYYKKDLKIYFKENIYRNNYTTKKNYDEENTKLNDLELQILEFSFSLFKLDFVKEYRKIKETFENFEIIFSNPPYISKNDVKKLDRKIKFYEPKSAYFAKDCGDFFYKKYIQIIEENSFIKNKGYLIFEIGDDNQGERVKNILLKNNYLVKIEKDLANKNRVLIGYKN